MRHLFPLQQHQLNQPLAAPAQSATQRGLALAVLCSSTKGGAKQPPPLLCWQELAKKEAELQLEKAEAVGSVVRAARTDLRQLVAAQRAAESEAAAAEAAAASAKQDSQALQQQQQTGWKPRVGQTVFVPRLNQAAKVVKVAGSGAITLQAGILKVTVTADEVRQR